MNWRILTLLLVFVAIVIFGLRQVEPASEAALNAYSQLEGPAEDASGYARAIEPWDWQFPRDHGAHPRFQTEWWYYTGVLANDAGRRFGFQFTIFRRALSPIGPISESEFRTNDIYMAHFTLSDIANETFYHDVRYSRGGGGLAGAVVDPRLRVWLEEWQILAKDDDATIQSIAAASADFAIDLTLEQVKPPALQGDNGLSAKSAAIGNASYYYSLTRLVTTGSISIGGDSFAVRGHTWMDHEFSTSALGENAIGWDWFGLIFDNDSELMLGQIRQIDGGIEPVFGGLLVYPDGSARSLDSDDFSIRVTDRWRSPHSDAVYPAGWEMEILGAEGFTFEVTPLQADQELHSADIIYWEGAVRISGDVSGFGYAELTGYASSMQNRF